MNRLHKKLKEMGEDEDIVYEYEEDGDEYIDYEYEEDWKEE